ncbi:negative elongation factor D-like isoform X1 [Mya arenaria]|uniref:negative elongation factor D-like isoform X1 n=2 Tax=Mya arenaria TaxID=6604 RepID=UPI0022E9048F|nr:negative elongation factor D-like isoform X1 [Mya arenaria]
MADYEDDDDGMWNASGEDGMGEGSPEHDDDEMGDESVQQECLETFASRDYIMEPGVFLMLKTFLQAGGSPEKVVELLSDNYTGVAQTVNLLAEWMIQAGVDIKEVQEMVESHLKEMIIRTFDPKKADSIFSDEGETPSWLAEMILFPTWRELFYRLAEEYPDCLMLNFTIKLISDAGFQGEITSVSTACHQIEVFSRVLRTSITSFLEGGVEVMEKNLPEFTKMVCHGEHTYLYSQVMMNILAQEPKGGSNIRRICQELQKCANQRGLDVTPITLALSGAAAYPRACQALSSMLSKKALNPADITILYKMYSDNQYPPPPVDLIRVPAFLDLLIESLFKTSSRLNQEHKSKYMYLLSYAASVTETYKKGIRKHIEKKELKPTTQALEKVQALCAQNKNASELLVDVSTLFQCIKFPVIAIGVLAWVDEILSDKSYFKLNTDHTPLHLVLVDEIVTNHLLLHQKALDLLVRLFESSFDELDVMVRLELKKTVLDRMVHLFSCGCVLPVVNYIRECHARQDTDISLIRHFVSEVLDVIAPPYTQEFVNLFLPLIENDGITGKLRSDDGNDPVSEFICHCKANYAGT